MLFTSSLGPQFFALSGVPQGLVFRDVRTFPACVAFDSCVDTSLSHLTRPASDRMHCPAAVGARRFSHGVAVVVIVVAAASF